MAVVGVRVVTPRPSYRSGDAALLAAPTGIPVAAGRVRFGA